MKIEVLTLFPEMFVGTVDSSILGKAGERGLLDIHVTDIRSFTQDKHNRVDDTPYGGGAGMVMSADPIFRCLESVGARNKKIIYMSPKGSILSQGKIETLSKRDELVILCGHYEGIDERILTGWDIEEISIGDYILTGGEPAAVVLIDAVARLIPGILGNEDSHSEESIYSGLLEYPQYTKPRNYRDMEVPEVLVNGDHKKIALWQFEQSLRLTKERRPDLFEAYTKKADHLTRDQRKIMEKVINMM
jgi:tRNA (guanine37-N1)-methyltransferase